MEWSVGGWMLHTILHSAPWSSFSICTYGFSGRQCSQTEGKSVVSHPDRFRSCLIWGGIFADMEIKYQDQQYQLLQAGIFVYPSQMLPWPKIIIISVLKGKRQNVADKWWNGGAYYVIDSSATHHMHSVREDQVLATVAYSNGPINALVICELISRNPNYSDGWIFLSQRYRTNY